MLLLVQHVTSQKGFQVDSPFTCAYCLTTGKICPEVVPAYGINTAYDQFHLLEQDNKSVKLS